MQRFPLTTAYCPECGCYREGIYPVESSICACIFRSRPTDMSLGRPHKRNHPVLHADGRRADRAAHSAPNSRSSGPTRRGSSKAAFPDGQGYSDWLAMTQPSLTGGGLCFDATWYGDLHHNLVECHGGAQAQLLKNAGFGDNAQTYGGWNVGNGGAKISRGGSARCRAACLRRPGLSQAATHRRSRLARQQAMRAHSAQANPTGRFSSFLRAP
ncbi:hypothetical protein Rleg4DRAFT_0890 [Rhizobium leguminosarum bv. trifolii WSM2297]|uniref:Uncharacterized protein n=1 Tax=Rhizobium leguminosarum bv. trifolii WSM2297 TaxID=754762 RepID=J0KPC9_RHILT|nr:hypothetical protein Rleg4DRAFT_0890 [Rhizobium leguminosarum bv. trifolii WSM2297]